MKGLAAQYQADEDQAAREHDKLLRGQTINGYAQQDAISMIQGSIQQYGVPVNPQTQQPFGSDEEIQSFLHDTGLQPLSGEDFDSHLFVHRQQMVSLEFESWPMQAQMDLIQHYNNTQAAQAENTASGEAPRVTYQIKGTAGAHTSAKILQKAGINTTPEEEAEEPLSTWVTDSLDKPDADSSGNDPLSEQELAMWQNQQAMHSSVAAAHEANASGHKANTSMADSVTALAKARQATANAQLAERKATAPLPGSGGGDDG
jgi:hypothetical protein